MYSTQSRTRVADTTQILLNKQHSPNIIHKYKALYITKITYKHNLVCNANLDRNKYPSTVRLRNRRRGRQFKPPPGESRTMECAMTAIESGGFRRDSYNSKIAFKHWLANRVCRATISPDMPENSSLKSTVKKLNVVDSLAPISRDRLATERTTGTGREGL